MSGRSRQFVDHSGALSLVIIGNTSFIALLLCFLDLGSQTCIIVLF
jgi:hypothetical protein